MTGNPSPDLFVRPDGLPMAFLMGPTGVERQQIKHLVEAGGGVLLSQPTLDYRDHIISLLVRTEIPLKKDLFDYKYILDCVEKNEILKNLNDYKVQSHLPSVYEAYNPLEVLLGNLKWSEVPKKVLGERVSDIEDDVGEELRNSFEADYRRHKAKGLPYCKNEQIKIVDWIVKYQAFKLLKGNLVWQRMEEAGVGRGRSWQSLKEHFKKVIIGQIHTFGLTQAVKDKFKVGMGMMEEVSTSGMDYETREEAEARFRPVAGIRQLRSRKPTRVSSQTATGSKSSSPSPPPNGRILRCTRANVKGSKVPADKFDQTGSSSQDSDGSVPPPPMNRRSTEDRDTEPSVVETRTNTRIRSERRPNSSNSTCYQTAGASSSTRENLSPQKLLVDVGKDAELEQLLDQTVLPPHLGEKFPSSGSSEDEVMRLPGKKRKLFSEEYYDSSAEEEDMFAVTPLKKKSKNKSRLELTKEMPNSEEFLAGLKEAASLDISREGSVGGVTSTQKGLDISGDDNAQPVGKEDEIDNNAEFELNLVISESGASSNKEGDVAKPISPTPPQSQNLLDPDPNIEPSILPDPSTYTLSQCVTDLAQLPIIQSGPLVQDEVFPLPAEEQVGTQDLVEAFNNIGEDLPGLRPSSRLSFLAPSSTPPPTAMDSEVVNSSYSDEVTDNPPRDDQLNDNDDKIDKPSKVVRASEVLSQSRVEKSDEQNATPLPRLKKSAASAQLTKKVPAVHDDRTSQRSNNVFDFSDHDDDQINDAPSPQRGRKVKNTFRYQKSGPYWNSLKRRGEGRGMSQLNGVNKSVEAHVGLTKGRDALLVVTGLPSDVDSEDIELVRTGQGRRKAISEGNIDVSSDESECVNEEPNSDNEDTVRRRVRGKSTQNKKKNSLEDPLPGPSNRERRVEDEVGQRSKYKLKIVSVGKENKVVSCNKAGRFQTDGEFFDKFRLPYTKREEEALVKYFKEEGGFKLRKGNKVWKQMEVRNICPGRTWQSMKQRWDKFLSKSLHKFKTTVEELEEIDVQEGSENGDDDTDLDTSTVSLRGFRANANYYTTADDEKILNFIIVNKRFAEVGGKAMWKTMEDRGVLPGRSWLSLKERFRKVIMKKIRSFGLSEDILQQFLSRTHEARLNTV